MKRRPQKTRQGTDHHAARGHVVLWATLMAMAKPNCRGSIADISREMLEAIDLDEKRKDREESYEL
jgi:hypothetical protein